MNDVGSFGIGALHIGGMIDKHASERIVREAMDLGVRFFDTAPLYAQGRSEEMLGSILSKTNQQAIICTKAGLKPVQRTDGRFGVEVCRLNAATLLASVEQSLVRLKREQIDLLLLHAFDEKTPLEETLKALETLHRSGKVSRFGCSNYNPKQLSKVLKSKNAELPFVAAQCHYNFLERRAEKSFIPLCNQHEMFVIVNRALARGALTGQYGIGKSFESGSRASSSPRIRKWLTEERLMRLDALANIAKSHEISLAALCIKWLLKNHSRMIVLLGTRNVEQLQQCLRTARINVADAAFQEMESVIQQGSNVYASPPRYFEK